MRSAQSLCVARFLLVFFVLLPLCWWNLAPTTAQTSDTEEERERLAREVSALERNPRKGPSLERVYGLHVESGQLENLVKRYEERVRQQPQDGHAWMMLGLLEGQRGKDAAAVAALQQAEEKLPGNALASYYFGQALVLVGQPEQAVAALERAIARKPARTEDLLEIYQELGRIHQRAQRFEKALAVWQRLEAAFPNDPKVKEQIAHALAEEGQYAPALTRYEALAQTAANTTKRIHFRLAAAEMKVRLNRRAEAVKDFDALLKSLPADDWLAKETWHKLEDAFLRFDDLKGLATHLEEMIAADALNVPAMALLARTLQLQGKAAESQAWLHKALQRAPRQAELRLALIDQLLQEQKIAEAVAQFEILDKFEPGNPDYIRPWGQLLLRDERRPEAERKQRAAAIWKRMLPAQGKRPDPVLCEQVADLLRQAELTEEALVLYQQAAELAPQTPSFRIHWGEYLHSLHRTAEALTVWEGLAKPPQRTAANLKQLGETLADFGFLAKAIPVLQEAITLEPKDADLRLLLAKVFSAAKQYPQALQELQAALTAASADSEMAERILEEEIRNHHAAGSLTTEITSWEQRLAQDPNAATARGWYRLARLRQAAWQWREAALAIGKSLALPEESAPARLQAWNAARRIHEGAGNLQAAIQACHQLARLDRRGRIEHLTQAVKLEARLGRKEETLQAGDALIEAAPGNLATYRFVANLCFQLGESDKGLALLQRAVRADRDNPEAVSAFAAALAQQYRTGEAIELYWRLFQRRNVSPDAKLAVIPRLVELYQRTNQFPLLIERLQRFRADPQQQQTLTLCLAEAYQVAGDIGTARQELERLLTDNEKKAMLLSRLTTLAERENDLPAALKYQRLLVKATPTSKEAQHRLALLLMRLEEKEEAANIWLKLARSEKDPAELLRVIDYFLLFEQYDQALHLTNKLLRDQPRNWDLLYREGMALAKLRRWPEAQQRFQTLLELRLHPDELSVLLQPLKAGKVPPNNTLKIPDFPISDRIEAVGKIRQVIGMERNPDPRAKNFWAPTDYGQARMATLGWMYMQARDQGTVAVFRKTLRSQGDPTDKALNGWWDWYYLHALLHNTKEQYQASVMLSRGAEPANLYVYLLYLDDRPRYQDKPTKGIKQPSANAVLPKEELDRVVQAYRQLRQQQPTWATPFIMQNVFAELRGANRQEELKQLFQQAVAQTQDLESVFGLMQSAAQEGDNAHVLLLLERIIRLQGSSQQPLKGRQFPPVAEAGSALEELMYQRAQAKALPDVRKLLDVYLAVRHRALPTERALPWATVTAEITTKNFTPGVGGQQRPLALPFPPRRNVYFDQASLRLLRVAWELHQKEDLGSDLTTYFQQRLGQTSPPEKIMAHLALAYFSWWAEEREIALRHLEQAMHLAPTDAILRLDLAKALEADGQFEAALTLLEALPALDSVVLQQRELTILHAASRLGKVDRARQAAERLFGLHLESNVQLQLIEHMKVLGLNDLAEAMARRMQSQVGNTPEVLASLMHQALAQNKTDQAVQLAQQVLRMIRSRRNDQEPETLRQQATNVLVRSGRLPELIKRTEAQIQASPRTVPLYLTLAEFYDASDDKAGWQRTYERLLKVQPQDAELRRQFARVLAQRGEQKRAVDVYFEAIRLDPKVFYHDDYRIRNLCAQTQQMERLGRFLAAANSLALRQYGQYKIVQVVEALLQQARHRALGLELLHKLWQASPEDRHYLLERLTNRALWELPEVITLARSSLIPTELTELTAPWVGISSATPLLLDSLAQRKELEAVTKEIEAAVQQQPRWRGGQALLVLLYRRQGKAAQARPLAEALLGDKENPLPSDLRSLLARHWMEEPAWNDLVGKLYTEGEEELFQHLERSRVDSSDFEQVLGFYRKIGDKETQRRLLRRLGEILFQTEELEEYEAYIRGGNVFFLAKAWTALGEPLETMKTCQRFLSEPLFVQNRFASFQNHTKEVETLLVQARARLAQELSKEMVAALLPTEGKPPEGPRVEFHLAAQSKRLDQLSLTSPLDLMLQAAQANPALAAEVQKRLQSLQSAKNADLTVQVVQTLWYLYGKDTNTAEQGIERLCLAVREQPLEPLTPGTRPNARQRAAALPQITLWLVARAAWRHPGLQRQATFLASQALEAAQRQKDMTLYWSMLYEQGLYALEVGNLPQATTAWRQLLRTYVQQAIGIRKTPPKPGQAESKPTAGGALTVPQCQQALALAKLAIRHKLYDLSAEAVEAAFGGGPPLADASNRTNVFHPPPALREVVELWKDHGMPPERGYQALVEVVLPTRRPGEIFMYGFIHRNDRNRVGDFDSTARMLVAWAVAADKATDLQARIEARKQQPLAQLHAHIHLALLGLARERPTDTLSALQWLRERALKSTTAIDAQWACVAAWPALEHPATRPLAEELIQQTLQKFRTHNQQNWVLMMQEALAYRQYQRSPEAARELVNGYILEHQRQNARTSYSFSRPYLQVALWAVQAGQWADAWERFGQELDLGDQSRYDSYLIWQALAEQLTDLTARERYDRLRTWTLPAGQRRSLRLFLPPRSYDTSPQMSDYIGLAPAGWGSSLELLVQAARETGQLHALAQELEPHATAGVLHADKALWVVRLAQGRGSDLKEVLTKFLVEMRDRHPEGTTTQRSSAEEELFRSALWDMILTHACLEDATLRSLGEQMVHVLNRRPSLRPQLAAMLMLNPAHRHLVLQVMQTGVEDSIRNGEVSLLRRLLQWNQLQDRPADNRDLLRRLAERMLQPEAGSETGAKSSETWRRYRGLEIIASELLEQGDVLAALPLIRAMEQLVTATPVPESYLRNQYERLLSQLAQVTSPSETAVTALSVPLATKAATTPGVTPANGLQFPLLVRNPEDLGQMTLVSPLAEALEQAAKEETGKAKVQALLQELVAKYPQDLQVQLAVTLWVLQTGTAQQQTPALQRLLELAEREAAACGKLPPQSEPRKAAAARLLALWLVARRCASLDPRQSSGERLTRISQEASRTVQDVAFHAALHRELLLGACQRKEEPAIQQYLLELQAAMLGSVPADNPKTASPLNGLDGKQLQQMTRLAGWLAELGRTEDALRLAMAAFGTGFPVSGEETRLRDGQTNGETLLRELEGLLSVWRKQKVPAEKIYALLLETVMPAKQPTALRLCCRPLQSSGRQLQATSAAALLAAAAVEAKRTDELQKRLIPYLEQPATQLSAHLLLALLALHQKDTAELHRQLDWLHQRFKDDPRSVTAELICQVALPALAVAPERAEQMLRTAVSGFATVTQRAWQQRLWLMLAEQQQRQQRPAAAQEYARSALVPERWAVLESRLGKGLLGNRVVYNDDGSRRYSDSSQVEKFDPTADLIRLHCWDESWAALAQASAETEGFPAAVLDPEQALAWKKQLQELPPDQRYRLLKNWTFTGNVDQPLRLAWSAWQGYPDASLFWYLAPEAQNPLVFHSFETLLAAAKAAGQEEDLQQTLQTLQAMPQRTTEILTVLTLLARGRTAEAEPLARRLLVDLPLRLQRLPINQRLEHFQKAELTVEALLLRACFQQAGLRATAKPLLGTWEHHCRRQGLLWLLAVTRHDSGELIASWQPLPAPPSKERTAWVPVWTAAGEELRVPVSPQAAALYFPYPLTGSFRLEMEARFDTGVMAQIGYGDLVFAPRLSPSTGQVFLIHKKPLSRIYSPLRWGDFNRLTLDVTPQQVRFLINEQLWHEEKRTQSSNLWLHFAVPAGLRGEFRKLRLTGSPQVPQEVSLLQESFPLGWSKELMEGRLPTRLGSARRNQRSAEEEPDWSLHDGILHGRQRPERKPDAWRWRCLTYRRPLQPKEQVRWEFFYEPGKCEAHPLLGRYAFLLHPDGVRSKFMHDLSANPMAAAAEAALTRQDDACRRGPEKLPLKPNTWNSVQLTLTEQTVRLELNGTLVYERALGDYPERTFGLGFDQVQTTMQVRNLFLTGDWPKQLTPEMLQQFNIKREKHSGTTATEKPQS